MPELIIAAVVLLLALLISGGIIQARKWIEANALNDVRRVPWTVMEQGRGGQTVVAVVRATASRELQRVVVAKIPDGAQDWTEQLFKARGDAIDRASALNSGRILVS